MARCISGLLREGTRRPTLVVFAFDDERLAVGIEVAIEDADRVLGRGAIGGVAAEVGGDVVDVAIAVDIAAGDTCPPAETVGEAGCRRSRRGDAPLR